MNEEPRVTDELLDQLVDGELSDEKYRLVLAAIELDCDGWRRCATAFLEAQAWRREMTSGAVQASSPAIAAAVNLPMKWSRPAFWWLAVAGSFLLVFSSGVAWQKWGAQPTSSVSAGPQMGSPAPRPEPELDYAANEVGDAASHVTLVVDRADGTAEEVLSACAQAGGTIRQAGWRG